MSPLETIEAHLARTLLSADGYAQYQQGDVSKAELAKFVSAIQEISRAYVQHSVGATLSSPIERSVAAEAYALYYTPINAAKILHLLPLLRFQQEDLGVLDVGCGPGTAGLAALAWYDKRINLTCVERSSAMRIVAERLLSRWEGRGRVGKLELMSSLPSDGSGGYDLVVAANVLAEMEIGAADELVAKLASLVNERGYLLLIEPGQQAHTRRLMTLRDKIVTEHEDVTPLFPCLRADPCPMLRSSETDWCHGTIEWRQPRLNAQLDGLLSFNKHRIKYSAFLFQRGGALREGIRVITDPSKERMGVTATVCGRDIYGPLRIRKGHRSENNRALEKASVFDRLLISSMQLGDLADDVVIQRPPVSL